MANPSEATSERLPGEDPEFQASTWKVQRWLKGGLFAVILLALGGGFGGSPWLDRKAADADFSLTFPSIIRRQSAEEWKISLGKKPEVWFDHDLIDAFDIEMILPDPDTKSSDHLRLTFRFPPGTEDIRIRLRAKKWGKIAGRAGSDERTGTVAIWSWP